MFALVDCNNFYASCERAFNPALNGKPVVVLSNNDGCVIARSNEAKALGIKMGFPAFKYEKELERDHVAVFSSNYTLYGDMSQRVMNTLATCAPNIEVYSIDEAFLNFTGFDPGDLTQYALDIRYRVSKGTGIPVSVGIGPSKTVAKIANHFAKKQKRRNGVCVIDTEAKITAALKVFPIHDVWGIGRQYSEFLERFKIRTAYDLVKMPDEWVRKNLSVVGLRTKKELLGESCFQMEEEPPAKKAICTSRSFGKMQSDEAYISEAISTFASACGSKLRAQQSCANIIMVFIHTNPFRKDDPQYYPTRVVKLPAATNSSIELVKYARMALKQIYKPGLRYKKAGVILSGIVPERHVQLSLYDHVDHPKHQRVMSAMDKLNARYGREFVQLAAQGTGRVWKLRQEKLSPCYTTRWEDVIVVKK